MSLEQIEFDLPHGYVDKKGKLHKSGTMRVSTQDDEVLIKQHGKYKLDHSYAKIAILAKVVTKLGTLKQVTPEIIADLYADDLRFLKALYEELNKETLE